MSSSTRHVDLGWERRPLGELCRLAGPIAISMLSYSLMTLVDTIVVGRLGAAALAGVGLGGTTAFALLCFWFGLLRGTKMSATPAAGHAACTYLHIRNLAAPLTLVFGALREVRYGLGDARSPMLASLAANVLNVALSISFVYGAHLGVAGVATATALSQSAEAGFLWLLDRRATPKMVVRHNAARKELIALLRIGLPTALQLTLEVGSFAILTAFISSRSQTQMAAHQIALQCCQFSFLPAFAIAEGAQVLAGQAVGARRDRLVLRVAWLALAAAGAYTALCSLVFAVGAPLVVAGFTSSLALSAMTVRLLRVAALFQVSDGANIVARAVLRGVGDVRFAAAVGVVTAWLMTPPLTWLLGARAGLGAVGGWLGLCGESVLGALVLWRRLRSGRWRASLSIAPELAVEPAVTVDAAA